MLMFGQNFLSISDCFKNKIVFRKKKKQSFKPEKVKNRKKKSNYSGIIKKKKRLGNCKKKLKFNLK